MKHSLSCLIYYLSTKQDKEFELHNCTNVKLTGDIGTGLFHSNTRIPEFTYMYICTVNKVQHLRLKDNYTCIYKLPWTKFLGTFK